MVTQEGVRPSLGAREPLAVAVVAVVAAVGVVVLASQRPPTIDFFGPVVTRAFVLTGWAYFAAGVLVRRRDTGRMIGALLLLAGALWFAQSLFLSRNGWVFTLGVALSNRHLAVVVHILLALPHGQLTRAARRLVILTYTVAAALSLLTPITYAQRCPAPVCPSPRPTIASPAWVQDLLLGTDRVGTSLIAVAVGVVLVVRLRRSGGATRRALAPVLLAGALLTSAYVVAQLELLPAEPALWLYFVTQALMPLSVLLGAVRARLHRGAVAELVVALDRGAVGDGLRDALARCLGDPTLRLAFPVGPAAGHIDASGEHLRLEDEPGRAQTPVEQDGRTIAVLDHDRTLLDEPDLLDAAVAASRLALRNAQLTAQVRAQLGELQRSRTRLVVAVDTERRRLERDLHDGVQQHLLAVALELGRLRNQARANGDGSLVAPLARTIADLEHAIDELRRFARGLHPQVLTDRGVPAALEALALRAPLPIEVHADLGRLPHEVESTLYLVATEALANTLRHGDASHLRIDARQMAGRVLMDIADDGRGGARAGHGTGLAGLQDRLSALGGGVTLESPRGQGTRLHVEIPVLAG
jgi:signal transduction histidine kinase